MEHESAQTVPVSREEERQRRFWHAVLDAIPDIVFVKDTQSVYIEGNRAFLAAMLRNLDASEPITDVRLFGEEAAALMIRQDQEILRSGVSVSNEFETDTVDRGRRWFETVKLPLVVEGEHPDAIVGIAHDITERKRLETQLIERTDYAERMKAAADEANEMKGRFLATMSHEIRTPMNGIMGFLELLSMSTLTADQRELLTEARNASHILLDLLNDLLDYSKIEAGKMLIVSAPFQLRELIGTTLSLFRGKAYAKGVDLVTDIRPDVPDRLVGDMSRIRQILMNVVGNAVKFTDEGSITVRVGKGGMEPASRGLDLIFEVEDTGIGIGSQDRERLFRPFVQLDSSSTRRHGGTGLGLAISRDLARLMGGDLAWVDKVGRGSTFRFHVRLDMVRDRDGG